MIVGCVFKEKNGKYLVDENGNYIVDEIATRERMKTELPEPTLEEEKLMLQLEMEMREIES